MCFNSHYICCICCSIHLAPKRQKTYKDIIIYNYRSNNSAAKQQRQSATNENKLCLKKKSKTEMTQTCCKEVTSQKFRIKTNKKRPKQLITKRWCNLIHLNEFKVTDYHFPLFVLRMALPTKNLDKSCYQVSK